MAIFMICILKENLKKKVRNPKICNFFTQEEVFDQKRRKLNLNSAKLVFHESSLFGNLFSEFSKQGYTLGTSG